MSRVIQKDVCGINDKPVNYICVVEGCDSALTSRLYDKVSMILPLKRKMVKENSEWNYFMLKNFAVVNINVWNNTPQLNCYAECSLAD